MLESSYMKPVGLLKKLNLLSGKLALDVGARDCHNSLELTKFGFLVDAIDINECPSTCKIDSVNYQKTKFEDFSPVKHYDIIIARHVIPFLSISDKESIDRLIWMLSETGILYFSLFGKNDEWHNKSGVTTSDLDAVKNHLRNKAQVLYESEEYFLGPTYAGEIKKWHIITIVLQNKLKNQICE